MVYEQCAKELLQILIHSAHSGKNGKMALEMIQGEVTVLYVLYHLGGSTTPGSISQMLDRSPSRIANTLNTLEDKGYITREHELGDRRKVTVHLTQTGQTYLIEKKQQLICGFARILQCLDEDEVLQYVALTQKLRQYGTRKITPEKDAFQQVHPGFSISGHTKGSA